jgi:hypothetical protein
MTRLLLPPPPFTETQRQSLETLQRRYRQDQDLFSAREMAQLQFLRWLHTTGRLVS